MWLFEQKYNHHSELQQKTCQLKIKNKPTAHKATVFPRNTNFLFVSLTLALSGTNPEVKVKTKLSGKSLGGKPNLTEEASAYNMNIPSYNIAFFDKLNYSGLKFCKSMTC